MRPGVSKFCSGLSLLLCLAVCGLWVRSYFVTDCLYWDRFGAEGKEAYWGYDLLMTGRGGVGLKRFEKRIGMPIGLPRQMMAQDLLPTEVQFRTAGPVVPRRYYALDPKYPEFWGFRGIEFVWRGFKHGTFTIYPLHPEGREDLRPMGHMWEVVVPLWPIALATAVLPAKGFWRWMRHRRRHGVGLCTACGYDLRATPDRCPECGRDAGAKEAA